MSMAGPTRELSRALPGATVLQILPTLDDSFAARGAVHIAAALLRSGARAIIAAEGGASVGELQALGGEWLQVPGTTHNPLRVRGNARFLTELISTEHVDIVHAYSGPTASAARTASHKTGALFVTTYTGAPPERRTLSGFYQGALARGRRVIVDSRYAGDLIMRQHDVPEERIVAIPPSVDTVQFSQGAVGDDRIAFLRQAWRVRPDTRVVLIPGQIIPANGHMTAVDAARIMINGGMRGVVFVIAGEGSADPAFVSALRDRIQAQGLGGIVRRAAESSPDLPAAYALADLIAIPREQPSTFDPVAAEAQAMGRLVVASAIGVLPEIVLAPPQVPGEERTGWLATPSDPVDLARAIAAALAVPRNVRSEIGNRARRAAERLFAPARVAGATLSVYTSLLESEH
jgi:glycosyltransferase involved in cell wall biosynthesis